MKGVIKGGNRLLSRHVSSRAVTLAHLIRDITLRNKLSSRYHVTI